MIKKKREILAPLLNIFPKHGARVLSRVRMKRPYDQDCGPSLRCFHGGLLKAEFVAIGYSTYLRKYGEARNFTSARPELRKQVQPVPANDKLGPIKNWKYRCVDCWRYEVRFRGLCSRSVSTVLC